MKLTFRIPSNPEFYKGELENMLYALDDLWFEDRGAEREEPGEVDETLCQAMDELDVLILRDKLGYFNAPAEFPVDVSSLTTTDLGFLERVFTGQTRRLDDPAWGWQGGLPLKEAARRFLLDIVGQLAELKAPTEGSA